MVIKGSKYVLVNKRRLFLVVCAFVFALFLLVFTSRVVGQSAQKFEETTIGYTVTKGDTLWDIAMRYKGRYGNMEVRKYVSVLKKANGRADANIYEGEYLLIPVLP